MLKKRKVKEMILGITKDSWIESLNPKEADEYFKLIDVLVVVTDDVEKTQHDPPYYYVQGRYNSIRELLHNLSVSKPYPQATRVTVNYSFVAIEEGMTPIKLKEAFINELQILELV
jgi:hypothetical protein